MKRGVTLIELIVVLAIIMILTGIGIAEFYGQSERARREAALVAVEGMAKGLQMYYADHKENYPLPGTTSVDILSPYVDIAKIKNSVLNPQLTQVGTAWGVSAEVIKISPTYRVAFFLENSGGITAGQQPVCEWLPNHSFQNCREGL